MIFINSEKINSRLFSVIHWHISKVINGHRPANLDCRIKSGNDSRKNSNVYLSNVINGLRPVNLKDHRIKSGDDWCFWRWLSICCKPFKYPSPEACASISPSRGEVTRLLRCARNDIHCLGRSMIEMLGVLAIIGVLSVGGIAGYSKTMTKFKTNQIADQVSTIVTNIKTLYAQQKNYSGLDNESAYLMGAIPEELGSGYNLTNPFNGNVRIFTSDSTVSMDSKAFMIFYNDLPKEACVDLVTNNWGGGFSSGLIAVVAVGESGGSNKYINLDNQYIGCSGDASSGMVFGSKGLIACPGGSDVSVPLFPSYASQACQCDNGNTCAIGWKYY